jgi:tetratricopeptide (TPR) repeat protein
LEIEPGLADAYASLGLLHTTLREAEAAIYNLKKAVELRPGYAEAHAWLCWILLLTGNSTRKLGKCEKRCGVESPFPGSCQQSFSRASYGSGVRNFPFGGGRMAQLQPDYTSAHFLAGLDFYHLKKYEEAIIILKIFLFPGQETDPLLH